MIDVVLINAPISFDLRQFSGDQTSEPPLGLMYIAAYLERRGISVLLLDPAAQKMGLESVVDKIKTLSPLMVGVSSLTSSLPAAVQLAAEIKKVMPQVCVGIGGPHVNVDPDFIHRFSVFDFEVVGEGEKEVLRLVGELKKGKQISGVYQGTLVENLDELPFPQRDQLDNSLYHTEEPSAVMIASRGCPFHCSFCSIPGFCRKVRVRSIDSVVNEMEELYDSCRGNYSFVDDCFTLNKNRTLEFCHEIISRGLKVRWMAMTRADMVDDDLLKAMAQSGCIELFFGVESGNEMIRKKVLNKIITDKQIFNAIASTRKYGIVASIFLMLGFPQEGVKEIDDTVRFGSRCGADTMGIHLTVPLPGSDLFKKAIDEKQFDKEIIDKYALGKLGSGFRNVWPAYIPSGLTKKDLMEAKKLAYRLFYLDPKWVLRRLWRDMKSLKKLKQDISLVGVLIHALIYGETKTAMS